MKREDFVKVAEQTLDSLPEEFRIRIQNVAILVEDFPANQRPPKLGQKRRLLLGIFHGVPATKRSVFNLPAGPDHIVLYQTNIEAVCSNEAESTLYLRVDEARTQCRPEQLLSACRPANLDSIQEI